jgi:2-polyprenyl-3-methyl-5-hydroxy-6-metoxy-1,4-benzoquinol methylase
MEKLWSLGKTEFSRRTLVQGFVALVAAGFAGKWLADEYAESYGGASGSVTPAPKPAGPGSFIDVREFKKTMTVEALNRTAEGYFVSSNDWEAWLTKPFSSVDGAPDLLMNVSNLFRGLQLEPGMTVLDFGAGSCWLSRWLTQMGMGVIALDVSPTALKVGRALYERQPVIGQRPAPRFLVSDGHRIDLPDASVDRILCLDVFHHLLNPDGALREMSRVLKPGGIAGFSEPGPNHSKSPGAQYEMHNFKVLEDDVDIVQIWSWAKELGFFRLRLGVFSQPILFTLPEFEDFLKGGTEPSQIFQGVTRAHMQETRLFFLHKGGRVPVADSRSLIGLMAKLEVNVASTTIREGTPVAAQVIVTNGGRALWLPRSAKNGAVYLGCHLLDGSGKMLNQDFSRHALTPGDGRPIAPGETVKLDIKLPALAKGRYILEFDLVSESVIWFAYTGSQVVRIAVQVGDSRSRIP